MKKADLGQMISVLANIGVIAGIAFLAVELRQNNDELRIQARQNVYEMQAEIQRNFFRNDGGLADLYFKEVEGENLTRVESSRLASYRTHLIRTMAFIYGEDPERANDSIDWMITLFAGPGMRELWEEVRADQDSEFVEFIENNVLSNI
jgi:hypothetical protein